MKKALFMILLLGTTAVYAAQPKPSEKVNLAAEANSAAQQVVHKAKDSFGWDWLRRTDISFEVMELSKPTWSIETIQPIYQTPDSLRNTFFFQGRWAYRGLDNTFNLGLGYRYLAKNQQVLLGVNGFYDVTTRYNHQRLGAGAEIIGKYVTLRGNYYHPVSNKKTISDINGIYNYEQAQKGYDGELDLPLPFLPWMRIAGNLFRWKSETSGIDDVTGNIITFRSNLTKYLFLEFGQKNDSIQSAQKFVMLTLNLLGKPNNGVQATLDEGVFNHTVFEGRNLIEHTLDKVRRQNDIIVEKTSAGGSGVVIGRGN